MSIGSEPSDLDPQIVTGLGDARVDHSLFEPLVSYEPVTFAPKPALAESWDYFRRRPHLHLSSPRRRKMEQWRTRHGAGLRRLVAPHPHATIAAAYASLLYVIRGAEEFNKGQTKIFARRRGRARCPHARRHPGAPRTVFSPMLLNSPLRPVNVREIAKYGDPYQRRTPWTRAGRLVSSGPFVLKEWNAHQHILVENRRPTTTARASA